MLAPSAQTRTARKRNKCEHFCRRFHAYQQARYRYHEHLLEKHCQRILCRADGRNPKTKKEARACLIGWLSKKRGFSKHPLVKEFQQKLGRKRASLSLAEKKAYHAERQFPSRRPRRVDADEIGWLILTWPVWNFHEWRWVDIPYAIRRKFRVKDKKGKPLDFLAKNRKRLTKEMRSQLDQSGSMPAEQALGLFGKHLFQEAEGEREWRSLERKQSDDKAIEQRCRRIGLPIVERAKGLPQAWDENKKPALWDFAYGIAV